MIDDLLRASVERAEVPAVVVAVAAPDHVLYTGAFGKRDVANDIDATPDTIFRIASMTKPITSLAAMMLVEERRIDLDDPVSRHLPHFREPPMLVRLNEDGTYTSRSPSRPISIRHLLTHTSGIAYRFFHPALRRLSAAGVDEVDLPAVADPGERWTYGPSTAILGRVVAHVSGQTLDDFCRERLFEPLGMTDTAYAVPQDTRHRVATFHQRNRDGSLAERPNPPAIASRGRGDDGLFSTVGDYVRFMQLFLNGGRHRSSRVASEQTIAAMSANQIGDLFVGQVTMDDPQATPFPPGAGKDKFGFGFALETAPSPPGRRRPGSLSWAGVFNTNFWIDPAARLCAVMMAQLLPASDAKASDLLTEFERQVYARRWPAAAPL